MLKSTISMENLTITLIPVEITTILVPKRGPKMATYLGSKLLMLKMGSMNMLPNINTIMA